MQNDRYICDGDLLRRIKCDDSKALRILFERYFAALCHFASKFVKNSDLAEESVSDVFLNVWLKRERIEIKTNLKTYLYVAVRNQSLNYLKKNKKYLENLEIADREEKISDLNADRFIQYEEFKEDIDSLLRQLPEKRQMVFRMNRLDGLSYKEIAEILSISVNTVQNQMVEAVKFLSHRHPRHK
jgi:RNA polymerase sigma factor, sigma-70 family/RNA polymerase sigma-70 factor, Bacteroides expansion family 1